MKYIYVCVYVIVVSKQTIVKFKKKKKSANKIINLIFMLIYEHYYVVL